MAVSQHHQIVWPIIVVFVLPQQDGGICDEVFQIPEKLHVTVGVMRLFSTEEEVGLCYMHMVPSKKS